jgi:uroporphyrin-III C-methyltransferase
MTSLVHLVGAGPGDPELLTVRAARLLAEAELVLHDQLVSDRILELVAPGAEVVPVGRRRGAVTVGHQAVVVRMAAAAHAGRRVVRLKGGDPVVFGRGSEETLALSARGVATELVPGITSAVAAPELAGIPLTHRGLAAGFMVLTGQRRAGEDVLGSDWDLAARFSGTLVVLMGSHRCEELCATLIARGRPPTTPAAMVAAAGRPEQRTVLGQLDDLADRVAEAALPTPAVLVIGDVVQVLAVQRAAGPGGPHPRGASEAGRTSTAACL